MMMQTHIQVARKRIRHKPGKSARPLATSHPTNSKLIDLRKYLPQQKTQMPKRVCQKQTNECECKCGKDKEIKCKR